MIYRFGPFELHTQSRELRHEGQVCTDLSTQAKVYDVLLHLIEHRYRVVPYAELLEQFWPAEANTTPAAMPKLIARLRGLLQDHNPEQPIIKTYLRVGYRFVAPAESQSFPTSSLLHELQPFVAGPPLTHPVHFFGRERELSRLFNLWKRSPLQNAAIIGPRRSGKTSLLLYLQHITTTPPDHLRPSQRVDWLPEPERYHWIFVDFQDPRFGKQQGLLRYLLTSLDLPIPDPCDLDRFLDVMNSHLQSPTVILLDEIDVALHRYPELDDAFWEGLRALITQVGGNLAFVLAARESPSDLAHSSRLGSPFFNIFGYMTTLGLLTESEAHELIASSPRSISAADTDWILTHSGRWPLLLQILCRERLAALEAGETNDAWREDGLHQLEPYHYLLQ